MLQGHRQRGGEHGIATVSDSTFWGNAAAGNEHLTGVDSPSSTGTGPSTDNGGAGTVVVSACTFSGNVATHASGTVAKPAPCSWPVTSSRARAPRAGGSGATRPTTWQPMPRALTREPLTSPRRLWVPWRAEVGRPRRGRSPRTRPSGSSRSTRPSRLRQPRDPVHDHRPAGVRAQWARPATPGRCNRPVDRSHEAESSFTRAPVCRFGGGSSNPLCVKTPISASKGRDESARHQTVQMRRL